MDNILGDKMYINGKDVWKEFGVFLAEKKRGDRNNLKAIMTPSKTKPHVAVDIREANGEGYSENLQIRVQARDVKLCFALYADTREDWLSQYKNFLDYLKEGDKGWLELYFTGLELKLHVFYKEASEYEPLTYLWKVGKQAGRFYVTFREPEPAI